MTIFVDMDNVLADFDAGYEATFGIRASKLTDNVDWAVVRPSFFDSLPPMADYLELWARVERYNPTVLTGVPSELPQAIQNKRRWIDRHLGEHVPVIGCRSKHKSLYCRPGDLLIDDWERYRDLWLGAGGLWITHVSAAQTARELERHGL